MYFLRQNYVWIDNRGVWVKLELEYVTSLLYSAQANEQYSENIQQLNTLFYWREWVRFLLRSKEM